MNTEDEARRSASGVSENRQIGLSGYDEASDSALETAQSNSWASGAHERSGGQIGNGLLHSIEQRLGSIL
ncbi:MAG: hypothetical protein AAFY25_14360 [Pseudomonadota bacterium]